MCYHIRMNKKKCLLIAGILLFLGLAFGVMGYFMFHYLTPAGVLSKEFHSEPQKPVVTFIAIGLSVEDLFAATILFLLGLIKYSKNKRLN